MSKIALILAVVLSPSLAAAGNGTTPSIPKPDFTPKPAPTNTVPNIPVPPPPPPPPCYGPFCPPKPTR